MAHCEITGDLVLKSELVKCCESGKWGRYDIMKRSPISGRYFLPGRAKQTTSDEWLPYDEVCRYCGEPILLGEESIQMKGEDEKHRCHLRHYIFCSKSEKYVLREKAFLREADGCWYAKKMGKKTFCPLSINLFGLPEDIVFCERKQIDVLKSEKDKCDALKQALCESAPETES